MPKFIFLGAPKLGFANELGFFAIMMAGFEDDVVILPILDGLMLGFEVAAAVTLPSSTPSSLEMNSSMFFMKI